MLGLTGCGNGNVSKNDLIGDWLGYSEPYSGSSDPCFQLRFEKAGVGRLLPGNFNRNYNNGGGYRYYEPFYYADAYEYTVDGDTVVMKRADGPRTMRVLKTVTATSEIGPKPGTDGLLCEWPSGKKFYLWRSDDIFKNLGNQIPLEAYERFRERMTYKP